jgi:hypothetical protein
LQIVGLSSFLNRHEAILLVKLLPMDAKVRHLGRLAIELDSGVVDWCTPEFEWDKLDESVCPLVPWLQIDSDLHVFAHLEAANWLIRYIDVLWFPLLLIQLESIHESLGCHADVFQVLAGENVASTDRDAPALAVVLALNCEPMEHETEAVLMPENVLGLRVVGAEDRRVVSTGSDDTWLVCLVGLGALVLLHDKWKLHRVLVEMDDYFIVISRRFVFTGGQKLEGFLSICDFQVLRHLNLVW